jgi:hypothetical protein
VSAVVRLRKIVLKYGVVFGQELNSPGGKNNVCVVRAMGNVHNPEEIIRQILSEKVADEPVIRAVTLTYMGSTSETMREIVTGAQRALGGAQVDPQQYYKNEIPDIFGFSPNVCDPRRDTITKFLYIMSVRNPEHRMYKLLYNHGHWSNCADCDRSPRGELSIENNCFYGYGGCGAVKLTCRNFCKRVCHCGFELPLIYYSTGPVICPKCKIGHDMCPRMCDCEKT